MMIPAMVRRSAILILIALMILVAPWKQPEATDIKVVSMVLGEGLQKADKSGLYGDVITDLLKRSGSPAMLQIYPFKRSLNAFLSGDADCIWGMDVGFLGQFHDTVDTFVQSALVFNSSQYLFFLPGERTISSIGEMRGKAVGVLNGANIEGLLEDNGIRVVQLPNQETKIRMLVEKRLDAVGGWMPDLFITMKQLGYDPGQIRPVLKLSGSGVRIVCHKSAATEELLVKADLAIQAYRVSGDYSEVLKKYGVPADFEW